MECLENHFSRYGNSEREREEKIAMDSLKEYGFSLSQRMITINSHKGSQSAL